MPSALRLVLSFPLIVAVTGCPSDNQDTGSTDISTSISVMADEPRCPAVQPDAAELPADAGRTPRADGDAEQLAVEAECALVASDAVYERVAAELTGIRAVEPMLTAYHPQSSAAGLIVTFDDAGINTVRGGTHDAWEALNRGYRAEVAEPYQNSVVVSFPGRHNTVLLTRQYVSLPNVTHVSLNVELFPAIFDPDAPPRRDICLTIEPDSRVHYYLFAEQQTGRPAIHLTAAAQVDADGNITVLDPAALIRTSPAPAWYDTCVGWLFGHY